ncbi:MAG: D-alanyl-D-alanine carboxypeptidase/D-alanyl-D-alanine endopeptidase, partial [Limisphaerales bacterium]
MLLSLLCVTTLSAKDSSLAQTLKKEAEHSRFKHAQLGLKVIALPSGRVVFDHQGDKLFRPASNGKLFTGALVLDRFDPGHRLQTSCYTHVKPDAAGTVSGDLILYGRGDPSFSRRFQGGTQRLKRFAQAIQAAGIRQITGRLIADESYFNAPPFGSGWTWDDLGHTYGAEVSSLSVNDNVASLKIQPGRRLGTPGRVTLRPDTAPFNIINRTTTIAAGAKDNLYRHRLFQQNQIVFLGQLNLKSPGRSFDLTVHRPAKWFGELLKKELTALGIRIAGPAEVRNHPE